MPTYHSINVRSDTVRLYEDLAGCSSKLEGPMGELVCLGAASQVVTTWLHGNKEFKNRPSGS